jgi:monoamine oxidase
MTHTEVLIIGAGAAGLSAARAAELAGLSYIIVEGKGRPGGRAYTESTSLGVPFDHGAHFLHAASRNPFRLDAERIGFDYLKGGYNTRIWDGRWLSADECREFHSWSRQQLGHVATQARADNSHPTSTLLSPTHKYSNLFRGYYSEFLGADAAQVAAGEHLRYDDTNEDWPLRRGYGALLASYGAQIPVMLDCPVDEIDHTGREIIVRTRKGSIRADSVVITASTGVLAAEIIRFAPRLDVNKLRAIEGMPMGYAGKIAFRLGEGTFAETDRHHGLVNLPDGTFANIHVKPFDQPIAVVIVGGPIWEDIERAGPDAMIDAARGAIGTVYGASVVQGLLGPTVTDWLSDPFIRGGHSFVHHGYGMTRQALAEPIDRRIYFAGEAASAESWATMHGARASAERAISAIAGRRMSRHPVASTMT